MATASGTRASASGAGDTIVAIHQPNFFPWLGYFDKLARSDVFVFMDNVQFPKGSWVNRVRLMVNGEARWATAPVLRSHASFAPIKDVVIDDSRPWRAKLVRTIELSYGNAPHFEAVFPLISSLLQNPAPRLAEYNVAAIGSIADLLGLRTQLLLGSEVGGEGQATQLLVSMVQRVAGTAYLCGAGSTGYQDDEALEAAGIHVLRQRFTHPEYPQRAVGPFVPGLSVIDVLMNCGVEATRAFLSTRSGEPAAAPAGIDGRSTVR
ncbi:MAG: WbqC family protein [Actinomycetota bacterium]|nr:WbqC family protein [Actinomycetota bacterium]